MNKTKLLVIGIRFLYVCMILALLASITVIIMHLTSGASWQDFLAPVLALIGVGITFREILSSGLNGYLTQEKTEQEDTD